jgi:hypothetical protein
MNRDDIIKMAHEAGLCDEDGRDDDSIIITEHIKLFAALVAAAERNKLAAWMMARGYATGHGDSIEDLLQELDWQIAENWTRGVVNGVQAEREACAKVADSGRDPRPASDPETYLPGVRTASLLTANSIAAAIRARGQA